MRPSRIHRASNGRSLLVQPLPGSHLLEIYCDAALVALIRPASTALHLHAPTLALTLEHPEPQIFPSRPAALEFLARTLGPEPRFPRD